ncbi:MAG: RNA polymerase sigma factor [Candidatus Berkelbacteria bacterium]|nr:RNA polymerase sigma factor [Candidatus Berkelbacteria bacterium]
MDYSDEELARLTVRNKKYFDPLVGKYAQKIRAYIARLTGNWPDSEDITQEAFIKAYVNIASFNPKLKFSSWLYRIAHNEAVNYIKKHYRYRQVEFSDEIKNKLIDDSPALSKILEKENAKMVRDSLLKLNPRDREILELTYFEEKSYLEIADILEISVNSVGPTIKRSREKLKKIIKKYG